MAAPSPIMPFTIEVQHNRDYLRYNVAGPPSLKNYFDLIEGAAKRTIADNIPVVMVDLRQVTGRLSFTDQFFIGDVIGDKLTHIRKLAVLVRDAPDSYNSPNVAVRKGVNIRGFADEQDAIEWLRGSEA